MIIIDQEAQEKLIQALKSLKTPEGKYCIRLHPIEGNIERINQKIFVQAQEYLPDANIYFCEDGENYLLTNLSSLKECKKAMLAIATELRVLPVEHVGELYELGAQIRPLLNLLERKINNTRNIEEVSAKHKAEAIATAQLARKRQEILEQDVRKNGEQIAEQRKLRDEPVLMIIEDDPFSRRLVENVLQKRYNLIGLSSAEDALSTYARVCPDLLFLDINLPDVTGHELLEKIIALDPKAYVVMLSGNADKYNIMQALHHGATGFVAKPFSREKLFQYIERCPTITKEKV